MGMMKPPKAPAPEKLQENPGEADMYQHPVAPVMVHEFKPPASTQVHGYRHSQEQRQGALRMSGHAGAHRLGKK